MFGTLDFPKVPLGKLYNFQLGKTPTRNEFEYWLNGTERWITVADMAYYDRYTGDTEEKITKKAVRETGIIKVPKNTVIMSFKLTIGRTAITSEDIYTNEAIIAFLDKHIKEISADYLRIYLSMLDWTEGQMNAVKGRTLNQNSIGKTFLEIPPKNLQDEFDLYVDSVDKLKFEALNSI